MGKDRNHRGYDENSCVRPWESPQISISHAHTLKGTYLSRAQEMEIRGTTCWERVLRAEGVPDRGEHRVYERHNWRPWWSQRYYCPCIKRRQDALILLSMHQDAQDWRGWVTPQQRQKVTQPTITLFHPTHPMKKNKEEGNLSSTLKQLSPLWVSIIYYWQRLEPESKVKFHYRAIWLHFCTLGLQSLTP